jgi:predicted nucleotidyltransferase
MIMDRDEALSLLRAHMDELRTLGVQEISIFGSVARGEAGPDSDVDVLVELGPGIGLFRFVDIRDRLSEILGRPVDMATPDGLKPRIKDRILAEAVRAA